MEAATMERSKLQHALEVVESLKGTLKPRRRLSHEEREKLLEDYFEVKGLQ